MTKSAKLTIIYDISLLGRGHQYQNDRTGLFRCAEELLNELLAMQELDLIFIASQVNHKQCQGYLEHNFPLHQHRLLVADGKLEKIINLLRSFIDWLVEICTKHKLPNFLARKIAGQFGLLLHIFKIKYKFIPKATLEQCHAYLSPYYAIPLQIKNHTEIKQAIIIHDLIPVLFPEYFGRMVKYFYQYHLNTLTYNDIVICNSKSTQQDLLAVCPQIDPKKVFTSYCGISKHLAPTLDQKLISTVRTKYNIAENSKYILSVSSLNPRKNLNLVINAFIEFIESQNIDDTYLVLVGPKGWAYDETIKLINDTNSQFSNKIISTGFVADEDLAPLYSGALCFTYLSLYEGFGLPVLEAMSCGTPVITSNVSSLQEIAERAAITLDPKDKDGLIKALQTLYSDDNTRKEFRDKGLARARDFSWQNFATTIINFLQNI